ncbi:MAG TPA: hypothetical protein VFI42_18055 [Thermomicrobiaceae bacterium]|nr:hypothetical protein [Thermomicrobiaceae bacterium]
MSSKRPQPGDEERQEPLAKDYPASKAHHMGPEGEGPTPDEEFASDTELAAKERGAHAQRPVGGRKEDIDKP